MFSQDKIRNIAIIAHVDHGSGSIGYRLRQKYGKRLVCKEHRQNEN